MKVTFQQLIAVFYYLLTAANFAIHPTTPPSRCSSEHNRRQKPHNFPLLHNGQAAVPLKPASLYATTIIKTPVNFNIKFLGGCREVGRSAILINEDVLLDFGIKPTEPPQYPLNPMRPSSVIISHGHLDHCGLVPNLMDIEPDIFVTPVTKKLSALLAKDTLKIAQQGGLPPPFDSDDIPEFERKAKTVRYKTEFEASGFEAQLFDAGHIPGSSSVYLEKKNKSILYTGDINTKDTHLLEHADTGYPDVDILIIESTYFDREHPPRIETENRFIESIKETLDDGGCAVIPCFAIGRTQEILMALYRHGVHAYIDGMSVDVTEMLLSSPEYLRDFLSLREAYRYATPVKPDERSEIPDEPSVIVTTAGMLNGGPVLYYLKRIHKDPSSKVLLTGYQVEGTNGRMAVERGIIEQNGNFMRLSCKLEQYDFSAHCGDSELKNLIKHCDCQTVIPVHGDNTGEFAGWIKKELGIDSYAPKNGEEVTL